MNLKHCRYMAIDVWDNLIQENLRNAWKNLWIVSKKLESKKKKKNDQNNLDYCIDLFNDVLGLYYCDCDDAID